MGGHRIIFIAAAAGLPPIHRIVPESDADERGGDIPYRHIHLLPQVMSVLGAEGSYGPKSGHHPSGVVHGMPQFHWRGIGVPCKVSQATQGGKHGSVPGVSAFRSGLPIRGQGDHDDIWINLF